MKNQLKLVCLGLVASLTFSQCSDQKATNTENESEIVEPEESYSEFSSQVEWGAHLVTVAGCNDCHTPKVMTDHGPVPDTTRILSGHPANMPKIDVDRAAMQAKGLVVTMDLTEWVGPWGTSYTANLTPDPTGIGAWSEEQFFKAIREGKSKGLDGSRPLLPPMPWEQYRNFTDNELKAVFAYLKTIPAVDNIVPQPLPPAGAPQ